MSLPDGSMVLMCPVGPDYSQVGDSLFDEWQANDLIHIEEITDPSIFAIWFSNVKRVTTEYRVDYTDGTDPYVVNSNGIQWRCESYLPVEANTGDHPFPKTRYSGDAIETPHSLDEWLQYQNEEYPTDAYGTGMPSFFIHKDKFYFQYPLAFSFPHTAELTADHFNVTYIQETFSSTNTISYTITIDQLFYP